MRCGAALLLLSLVAATPRAGEMERPGYRRPLEVDTAGWVRLRLDGRALAHGQSDGSWSIRDPEDNPLPTAVLRQPVGFVPATTLSIVEQQRGWQIVLDLGWTPLRHNRLVVEPLRASSAPGCLLEASTDQESWTQLARGDLFRLGRGSSLGRFAMDYEESEARFLRLSWPRGARFPELRRVGVETTVNPQGGAVEVALQIDSPRRSARRLSYELIPPGPRVELGRMVVRGSGGSEAPGYRLLRANEHGWERLASGTLESLDPALLLITDPRPAGARLRLELYSGAELELESVVFEVPPVWLLFRAERAGWYSLLYGGEELSTPLTPQLPFDAPALLDIVPGAEEERELSALDSRLTRPFEADRDPPSSRWSLRLANVGVGDVARLELPDEIWRELEAPPEALRLVADGKLLPFVLHSDPSPEWVLDERELSARPVGGANESAFLVELDELPYGVTQLELTSWSESLRRSALARCRRSSRPGSDEWGAEMRASWLCEKPGALPCSAVWNALPRDCGQGVRIRVETDLEAAPAPFSLAGWRPRRSLLFVRPDAKEVTLTSAARRRSAVYPLERESQLIAALPYTPVTIEARNPSREAWLRSLRRGALIAALVAVAALLLWILGRNITR